jgi:soluble lytic murein transglycosylase
MPFTLYGQLAMNKLGKELSIDRTPVEVGVAVAASDLWDVYRGLVETDLEGARTLFGKKVVDKSKSIEERKLIADFASSKGDFATAFYSGRIAALRDHIVIEGGYPAPAAAIEAVAADARGHKALILALIAFESAFEKDAVSSKGALGLMQLLPTTGRVVAERVGISFKQERLLTDAAYNVTLGTHELDRLLKEYTNYYPLAVAAYNAGSGDIEDWLDRFGDPREPSTWPLDWIESLPFNETRTLMQRVLGLVSVYQAILNGGSLSPVDIGDMLGVEAPDTGG